LRSTARRAGVGVCAGLLITLTGCGSGATGHIVVTGSSTVEPISIAVSERFAASHPDIEIVVDGPGTGDGFKIFCRGEADVNDASSKIKPAQVEECAAHGVEFIELQIANDGIAVLTSADNETLECLTFADLYALTGPESQGFERWSSAQPLAAELGSSTTLPDAPLDLVGPGEESGTFSSYVELVIENFNEDRGQDATTRPDYQATSDDNVVLQGIEGSRTSLGWVGFAFARGVSEVRTLSIAEESDGPCVQPTDETIADGSYPIARPLFVYVNKARAEDNAALRDWVDFYLSDDGNQVVSDVGYVELSTDHLARTRRIWTERLTGAQDLTASDLPVGAAT
jgi:phosphate transport system substrate-binding protein